MRSSMGRMTSHMENKNHVPNHQPDYCRYSTILQHPGSWIPCFPSQILTRTSARKRPRLGGCRFVFVSHLKKGHQSILKPYGPLKSHWKSHVNPKNNPDNPIEFHQNLSEIHQDPIGIPKTNKGHLGFHIAANLQDLLLKSSEGRRLDRNAMLAMWTSHGYCTFYWAYLYIYICICI